MSGTDNNNNKEVALGLDLDEEAMDMPSLDDLPDFSNLQRQQTDVAQHELEINNTKLDVHHDDDIKFEKNKLIMVDNDDNKPNDDINDNIEITDDLAVSGIDDDGDFKLPSLPNLTDISRQTTDHAVNEEPPEMMMDQMDEMDEIHNNALNDDEIIMVPPRVKNEINFIEPKMKTLTNDDGDDKFVTDASIKKNKYLDDNLVLFDENGNLLDSANELFITKNDTENIQQIEDDSVNSFVEHKEPIICMALNPKKPYEIITGSQDENCFIWDIVNFDASECINDVHKNDDIDNKENKGNDNDTLYKNTGYYKLEKHDDTVMSCSFNSSGKFVATGSMDSKLKIYNYNKNMKLIDTLDIGKEISYLCWHPNTENNKKYRNILMTGTYDKSVWIYKYDKETKKFNNTQVLSGHSSEIECGNFTKFNNGKYAYSGDKDGVIIIWENIIDHDDGTPFIPFNGRTKFTFKPLLNSNDNNNYHESNITAMDDCVGAPLLISGSADSTVVIINYETGKILSKLGKHGDSVECVRFNKNYKKEVKYTHYASSSSLDGVVKIWDINQAKVRSELKHDDGVIIHEWFNTKNNLNLIATGCMDGTVNIWDTRTSNKVKTFRGHSKCSIQTLKITKDDKYAISGADDSICMVWEL